MYNKRPLEKRLARTKFAPCAASLFGCLLLLLFSCFVLAQNRPDTTSYAVAGRANAPQQLNKPYLFLISADGFRPDYAQRYRLENLLGLSKSGIRAKSMQPSYPSITFPNHYSIATGLYPSHHGLVDNFFHDRAKGTSYAMNSRSVRDSSWYGGTPIWVLAEQQQLLSATLFWPGSEAPIKGIRPSYYYHFSKALNLQRRLQIIRQWLTLPPQTRPHLITLYIGEADHVAHDHGPIAPAVKLATQEIDHFIAQLKHMTDSLKLETNYIFLSDHGMAKVDARLPAKLINLPTIIDTSRFTLAGGSNIIMHLYARDPRDIAPAYRVLKKKAEGFRVYLRSHTPKRWQYNTQQDRHNRIGDIIITAENGKLLPFTAKNPPPGIYGAHGYDNKFSDMQATFYAWGPAFKQNKTIASFENVDLYPLLARLLGLTVTEKIDGKEKTLKKILSTP